MEVEHLVSYLYQVKGYLERGNRTLMTDPIHEIIGALRKGKEDKLMYRALRDKFIYIEQVNYPSKKYTYEDIKAVMDEVERRYLPSKILTKTVTIRLEAVCTDELAVGLKGISKFVNSAQIPKMQIINLGKMEER